jgi:hypothetical protein
MAPSQRLCVKQTSVLLKKRLVFETHYRELFRLLKGLLCWRATGLRRQTMGKGLTIFWVMVIVAVVSIDLASVRSMFTSSNINIHFSIMFIMGAVPMANVLVAGLFAGRQCRRYPPFLRGFEASGATALVIYVAAIWMSSQAIERIFLSPLLQPLADYVRTNPHATLWEIAIVVILIFSSGPAILAVPQLTFAFIGGSIVHKIAAQRTLVKGDRFGAAMHVLSP